MAAHGMLADKKSGAKADVLKAIYSGRPRPSWSPACHSRRCLNKSSAGAGDAGHRGLRALGAAAVAGWQHDYYAAAAAGPALRRADGGAAPTIETVYPVTATGLV
jgi:hypothetical protein